MYTAGWWKLFLSNGLVTTLMRSAPPVRGSPGGMAWHGVAWHGMAWRGMAPQLGSPYSRTSLPCTTEQEETSLPKMSVLHVCAQHRVKLPNERMGLFPFQSGRAASCPSSRMKPSVWKYHLLGEPYLVFIDVFN